MRILLLIIFLFSPLNALAGAPAITITEIAASLPSDQEWIEIFNASGAPINIENWRLAEGFTNSNPQGTRHKLIAYQGGLIIEPQKYAVIANDAASFIKKYSSFKGILIDSSWSSLKESGEFLQLIDDHGAIIEEFAYISAPDGILQRIDSYALNYTKDNWVEIIGDGSPGEANNINLDNQNNKISKQEQDTEEEKNEELEINHKPAESFTINLPPQAIIDSDNLTVLINQEIIFDGSKSFDPEGADLSYFWDFDDGEKAREKIAAHQFIKEGDYYARLLVSDGELKDEDKIKIIALEQDAAESTANQNNGISAKNFETETGAVFQGIVMIEPGIFAKTYFYLSSPDGQNCAQIYSSKADFPDLFIGQLVEARGIASKYYDVNRIKISSANDINIIKGQDPPLPREIDLDRISDDYLGCLINVSGQILKDQGKILIVDASGNNQLRLEIKSETGIQKTDLKESGTYKITGILDKTISGLRLLPRHKTDIEDAAEQTAKLDGDAQILGENINIDFAGPSQEIKLEANQNKKREIFKYLLTSGIFLIIILIGMQIKKRNLR